MPQLSSRYIFQAGCLHRFLPLQKKPTAPVGTLQNQIPCFPGKETGLERDVTRRYTWTMESHCGA